MFGEQFATPEPIVIAGFDLAMSRVALKPDDPATLSPFFPGDMSFEPPRWIRDAGRAV